jgi:hypothetical protein
VLAFALVNLEHVERQLRERLDALGPAPRAELLHVLMLPDFERADRIGEFWGYPESRTFAELLIDCEEDRVLRAVVVGAAGGRRLDAGNRRQCRYPPERHRRRPKWRPRPLRLDRAQVGTRQSQRAPSRVRERTNVLLETGELLVAESPSECFADRARVGVG